MYKFINDETYRNHRAQGNGLSLNTKAQGLRVLQKWESGTLRQLLDLTKVSDGADCNLLTYIVLGLLQKLDYEKNPAEAQLLLPTLEIVGTVICATGWKCIKEYMESEPNLFSNRPEFDRFKSIINERVADKKYLRSEGLKQLNTCFDESKELVNKGINKSREIFLRYFLLKKVSGVDASAPNVTQDFLTTGLTTVEKFEKNKPDSPSKVG